MSLNMKNISKFKPSKVAISIKENNFFTKNQAEVQNINNNQNNAPNAIWDPQQPVDIQEQRNIEQSLKLK